MAARRGLNTRHQQVTRIGAILDDEETARLRDVLLAVQDTAREVRWAAFEVLVNMSNYPPSPALKDKIYRFLQGRVGRLEKIHRALLEEKKVLNELEKRTEPT